MYKTNKSILLFAVCILTAQFVSAQAIQAEKFPSPKKFNSWTVGVNFGPTIVHGDVSSTVGGNNLKDYDWTFGFGGYLNKSFSHTIALQGNLMMGSLKGENKRTINKVVTTESFTTKINYDMSIAGVFTFGNISYLKRMMPNMNWYVSAGVGQIRFTPDSKINNVKVPEAGGTSSTTNLRSYAATSEIVVPISLGAKYKIGKNMSFTAEYCMKNVMTDKLDDKRVVFSEPDKYSYLNFGLGYTFGKKEKSLDWVNPLEELYTEMGQMRNKMDSLVGDKDKDGVADLYDKDNATPSGVKVYGDGTSTDTDGDGVPDATDIEIFSTKGAKVDAQGKELDADGDGVSDSRDLEPATEKGKLVNFQGITIKVSGGSSGMSGYDKYMPIVFFDFNKSNVKDAYYDGLAVLARILVANPGTKVSLFGNCDVVGTEATNNKLGQQRADIIKKHLVDVYGIDASRIEAVSKGKSEPFANTSNRKDKDPLNRRVDYKMVE